MMPLPFKIIAFVISIAIGYFITPALSSFLTLMGVFIVSDPNAAFSNPNIDNFYLWFFGGSAWISIASSLASLVLCFFIARTKRSIIWLFLPIIAPLSYAILVFFSFKFLV